MVVMVRTSNPAAPPGDRRVDAPAPHSAAVDLAAADRTHAAGAGVDQAVGDLVDAGVADTNVVDADVAIADATDIDVAAARRAAGGDLSAFEDLYHRHTARIYSLARRMLGEAEAEEATQDVFVRAWEKLGTFRGKAAFGTWLYRLAINTLLTRRAGNARREDRFPDAELVIGRASARPAQSDLRLDLERALAHLPAGAREVFTLYDIEGYPHEEVGRLLGITVGTSKSQLHRARMLLRAQLMR